jgi:hypothetical protein
LNRQRAGIIKVVGKKAKKTVGFSFCLPYYSCFVIRSYSL